MAESIEYEEVLRTTQHHLRTSTSLHNLQHKISMAWTLRHAAHGERVHDVRPRGGGDVYAEVGPNRGSMHRVKDRRQLHTSVICLIRQCSQAAQDSPRR